MRSSLLVVMTMLAVGCSSDQEEPTQTASTSNEQRATTGGENDMASPQAMAANCPMNVQGTSVQAENIAGGAALVFVTTGDVAALRERVRNMATSRESTSMSEPLEMGLNQPTRPGDAEGSAVGAKIGDADDGVSAGGMSDESMSGEPVDVDTQVEDIDDGARLLLIATNPSDVETLRTQTEQQAERLTAGECPMAPHSMEPSGEAVE